MNRSSEICRFLFNLWVDSHQMYNFNIVLIINRLCSFQRQWPACANIPVFDLLLNRSTVTISCVDKLLNVDY